MTGAHPCGQLTFPEDQYNGQQALPHPHEGDRRRRVVSGHPRRPGEHGANDRGAQEAEHRVGDEAGEHGLAVGGIAQEPAARQPHRAAQHSIKVTAEVNSSCGDA
ncbi:MAG: hypothetical protein WCC38_10465 [Pseudonocardiaceae bacterium]